MAELELEKLRTDRNRLPNPAGTESFESSVGVLRKIFSPWLTGRIEQIVDNPVTKENLASIRTTAPTASRPRVCAEYLRTYEAPDLYRHSQTFLEANQKASFVVLYDLASSVEDTANSIVRAEGVFIRGAKQEALQAFSLFIKKPEVTPEQTRETLERGAIRFQSYADLLRENHSGLHVMHYQSIQLLQNMFGFPQDLGDTPKEGYDQAVALLGDLYAAEVYKTIYPLSE